MRWMTMAGSPKRAGSGSWPKLRLDGNVGVHPQRLDEVVLDGPTRLEECHRRRRILAQDQRMRLLGISGPHDGIEAERLTRVTTGDRFEPDHLDVFRLRKILREQLGKSRFHDPKPPSRSTRKVAQPTARQLRQAATWARPRGVAGGPTSGTG